MALDLNAPSEYRKIDGFTIPFFKEFYGSILEQMPQLVQSGRVSQSFASVMERRLHSQKDDWRLNYFDTGDAFAYHPNGKFKVDLDSKILRAVTPQSRLSPSGGLLLGGGVYESLDAPEFSRKDVAFFIDCDHFSDEIKKNPILQVFARTQGLLDEYVDRLGAEIKQKSGSNKIMGIYPALAEKVPTLRSAYVGRLECWSRLGGGNGLGDGSGRLVGVAPGALAQPQTSARPTLEQALAVVGEELGFKFTRK